MIKLDEYNGKKYGNVNTIPTGTQSQTLTLNYDKPYEGKERDGPQGKWKPWMIGVKDDSGTDILLNITKGIVKQLDQMNLGKHAKISISVIETQNKFGKRRQYQVNILDYKPRDQPAQKTNPVTDQPESDLSDQEQQLVNLYRPFKTSGMSKEETISHMMKAPNMTQELADKVYGEL